MCVGEIALVDYYMISHLMYIIFEFIDLVSSVQHFTSFSEIFQLSLFIFQLEIYVDLLVTKFEMIYFLSTVRRKSVFRRESTTSSMNSTGSEALIENPTAKDLRKMLVTNPKKLVSFIVVSCPSI